MTTIKGRRVGSWEPARNGILESPLLKVPFSQSHRPGSQNEDWLTDQDFEASEKSSWFFLYLRGLFSGMGESPEICYNYPPPKSSDVRPSFISSLGHKELSCPIATTEAHAQTRAYTHPRSSLRASDYLSIHARTILLQSHFFFSFGEGRGSREEGEQSSRVP